MCVCVRTFWNSPRPVHPNAPLPTAVGSLQLVKIISNKVYPGTFIYINLSLFIMEAKEHSLKGPAAKEVAREVGVAPGREVAEQKNIVVRFVEYAYKVINEHMDDFFEDNMDVFDQDDEEVESGRGETFEQYEVFKRYLEEVFLVISLKIA